jgi:hypothetical protein
MTDKDLQIIDNIFHKIQKMLKTKAFYILYVLNKRMDSKNIHFTKVELKIVKYLFKHYKDKHNSRQLAKLLNINHSHASKLCNILVTKFLLKKQEIGNAVYFLFNYENKLAIKFMDYILTLEEKEFPSWLIVTLHNLKKFNEFLVLGLVFGSSIKSKKFNDVDVLLVYEKNKKSKVDKIKKEIRNSQIIEKPIRYVEITQKDIISNKEDDIFYNIISENLIFFNAEKYVEVIQQCLD